MSTFLKTTDSYQAGARTMPQEYYASPEIFARERDQVFAQQWICVGRARDFVEPGTYRLADIAGESLIVVRDRTGVIRAHYTVCRHRGTRLCTEAAGTFSETIQCPYHAWTYRLDGRLIGDVSLHLRKADLHGRLVEIGWLMATEHQGRGLAREAAAAMLDLACSRLRARQVIARMDTANEPSRLLAERLGFTTISETSDSRLMALGSEAYPATGPAQLVVRS